MKMKTLFATLSLLFFNSLYGTKEQERKIEQFHREEFRKTCYKIAAISSASTFVASFAGGILAAWAFYVIQKERE
jgi:hypothetical protein